MTQEPLLCVTGKFKFVACFEPKTLHLKYDIPTPKENFRVISIPPQDDRGKELLAVGECESDFEVLLLLHSSPHEMVDSPFRKQLALRCLLASHSSIVRGLCHVAPRFVVSGSNGDHELVVSDVNCGEKVMDLKDAPEGVNRIITTTTSAQQQDGAPPLRGDGFVFVGGGDLSPLPSDDADDSIRHYDFGRSERTNEVVQKFEGHGDWAFGLGYSTEKNLLFSSSPDKTLRIWSVQDGMCLETLGLFDEPRSLLFDPKKRLIFCGILGGIIEVWDYRQTKKRLRRFNHPTKERRLRIHDMTQIGDGTYASIGDLDFSVMTWTDQGKILATAKTSGRNVGVCYVGRREGVAEWKRAEAAAATAAFEDLMREDDRAKPSRKKNRRTKNKRKKGSRRRGQGRKKQLQEPRKAASKPPPPAAVAATAVPGDAAAVTDALRLRLHDCEARTKACAAKLAEVTRNRDACRHNLEESEAKLHAAEQARLEQARVNEELRETLRQRTFERDAARRELAVDFGSAASLVQHLGDEDILTIRAHHPYGPFPDAFHEIGRGSYSTVYYWVWKDRPVSLKVMNGVAGDAEEVAASIAALRRARHPNLSKLLAYSCKPPFCLVSELYHKTVAERIKAKQGTDWDAKLKIIMDTALGMSHLHACRIVHRDLKWQNVMISHPFSDPKWRAVVIDFGCVWIRGTSGRSELPGQGGTVGYKPPEIYETGAKAFTFPADVYAFGIMMFELLGETMEAYGPDFPMADPHMAVAAAKLIVEGHRPDPKALRGCLPSDTDWIIRLMVNCWSADPLHRSTFQQIVQRLREEEEVKAKKSVP